MALWLILNEIWKFKMEIPVEKTIGMAGSAVVGCGLLLYGLYKKRQLRASQAWQQVTGTIAKADILRDTGPESNGYSVSVLYDYVVNGVRHTGSRIAFRQRLYVRKKRAAAELERYLVNSAVPVYYDPENPGHAVLTREAPDIPIFIVSGIVILGIVVAGLLYG
jgi:hypothetical protein